MIDIHSHVLFGVDDGARSLEESIEHIRKAISLGYTGIVCSAHYKIYEFENKNYDKNFNILKREVLNKKLPITIYKGNELDIRGNVLNIVSGVNTINNSKYILIEFSQSLVYDAYIKIIDSLINNGYIPILAHVERYPYIKFKEFMKLYDKKVVLQMNIVTVDNMSKKIKFLLKKGYIDVVATDVHRVGRRDYDVCKYLEKLKKIVGEERYIQLTNENPRKIVMNENIDIKTGGEINKHEKILSFSRAIHFISRKLWNGINSGRCDSKSKDI